MEQGILTSTKKILGLAAEYTAFDQDVITHINSAFAILHGLGVGPEDGFMIEDDCSEWTDFMSEIYTLNMIRSYVYLKVRLLFDPPTTSYLIEAANNQAKEFEWRISTNREWALDPNDPILEEEVNNDG